MLTKTVSTIIPTIATLTASDRTSASATVDLENSVGVAITVTVTYQAAGSQNPCILEVYSSTDGYIFDSYPFMAVTIPNPIVAGGGGENTVQITADIPSTPRYVNCKVLNTDGSLDVTDVKVTSCVQNVE